MATVLPWRCRGSPPLPPPEKASPREAAEWRGGEGAGRKDSHGSYLSSVWPEKLQILRHSRPPDAGEDTRHAEHRSSSGGGGGCAVHETGGEACWSDEVLIFSHSDKFLRLSLQLISRYTTWLFSGLAARKASDGSSNSPADVEWALSVPVEDFIYVRHIHNTH
ncbi:hypothetical protein ABZP36_010364 [Zizania latifolia]